MKNNRKKILKILSCVLSVISVFCISVSAVTPEGSTVVYPFTVASIDIEVRNSSGEYVEVDCNVTGYDINSGRVRWQISRVDDVTFKSGDTYSVAMSMVVSEDIYTNGEKCVSANYRITTSGICAIQHWDNVLNRSYEWGTKVVNDGTYSIKSYNVMDVAYPYSDIGEQFNCYYNKFYIVFNSKTSYFTLNLLGVDFSAISESERAALTVTENQDKNTDKIINGGHESPSYEGADTTVIDEYESSVKEIEDSTKEGREQAISIFNGFGGNIQSGTIFGKGLLFVSQVFKVFFDVGWLSDLTGFSLALGVFAFILGVTAIVVKFTSHSISKRGD